MLDAISVDRDEITLGFEKRSDIRDVANEHLHDCIGQNQRIKPITLVAPDPDPAFY